ncbi:hypothetical protein MSAS_09450 [Mycobacterium saskatchewanense]|uniref:Uncharacterized protein n=1 Tax=Mycobacterium saskatchewanense TaxID=220927 RepID=A0AAJ3TTT2_9MYCO|nr:hypothetical protein [Mycobacterium saskatchewanense]ORW69102.1 hypothetical protein AWC23_20370 [Mycobacterium saskatchewanense]BBX61771.1 hypothetical protein MSAS_09450 [Mycobacterium saskatchewanense]
MTTLDESRPPFERRILCESSAKFTINAPSSLIDITDWLYTLGDQEYINCTPRSKAHLAAGTTTTPDGRRMSINVEDIGGVLIVEHYVEDISEKLHCRVHSISDNLVGREYTATEVVWELIAEPKGDDYHEFTNNVWVWTTPSYDRYLDAHRMPYEDARHDYQRAVELHNAEETPFFAASIERRALRNR